MLKDIMHTFEKIQSSWAPTFQNLITPEDYVNISTFTLMKVVAGKDLQLGNSI